jgi:ABC-type oligopeptide transport system substrate-binding subunit
MGSYPDLAVAFKEQMKRTLGINLTVSAVESTAGLDAFQKGDFEIGVISSGIVADEPEAVIGDVLRAGAQRNFSGWENPKVERLVALQRNEPDRTKRAQILRQLEDELLSWEDNHFIDLWWEPDQQMVHKRVRNFFPGGGHDTMKWEVIWLAP